MTKPRFSRKRTALRSLATMLVVLGTLAFAATIAMTATAFGSVPMVDVCLNGETIQAPASERPEGSTNGACERAPEWVWICHEAGKSGVQNSLYINKNGANNGHFGNNGVLHHGDTLGACGVIEEEPPSDPIISVCRNGAVVSIKTSEKLGTDGTVPCPVIDPEISVCRAGAVITILTSAKLATDTTPPCPAPGTADAGGPVDQGDAPVAGVEYPHDSLAPTNAAKDGPGAGPEYVVAGAADSATTVPGSGTSGAITPVGGQLPYTGLSTLQVALLGAMLLGMGALCWLVGTPRTKESATA